jgi:4-hydroxybenzoate polyprenyltransferase
VSSLVARLAPYIAIARFEHWFKHLLAIPGILVAVYANPALVRASLGIDAALALLALGLVASSYYVLNEILDAPQDGLHPVKKDRPIPSGQVDLRIARVEMFVLAAAGFAVAAAVNATVLLTVAVLWIMALLYNVPPVRAKDKPYLDVLLEAVNNPLRLLVGWYCTGTDVLPPASLVSAYWMVGAFFMAVKRFAEFRRIADQPLAAAYRRSFGHYNEERLLVSIVYYGVAFGLFFGIFMVRYRIELILAIPLVAGLVAWYIHLGFMTDSPAQNPERLFRQAGFTAYTALCIVVMVGLLYWDVPAVRQLFAPSLPLEGP